VWKGTTPKSIEEVYRKGRSKLMFSLTHSYGPTQLLTHAPASISWDIKRATMVAVQYIKNMELDLQSLFELLCTGVLIGWDPATPTPSPRIWARIRGRLLDRQDGWHPFVTPSCSLSRRQAFRLFHYLFGGGGGWRVLIRLLRGLV
jgi:hypothetical protein